MKREKYTHASKTDGLMQEKAKKRKTTIKKETKDRMKKEEINGSREKIEMK